MNWRVAVLVGVAGLAIGVSLLAPAIPQDPDYHQFADQRAVFGVANFWNVVSNLLFVVAGVYGIWAWRRAQWREASDRWPWLVVVAAAIFIGFGSGYYHWRPDNRTLFWDRLPMTLGFMGILSAMIAERIHSKWGVILLGPFLMLGMLSVEVWRRGELTGVGDLRFYALVQFYPMVALVLILVLFRARYTDTRAWWQMGGWYVAAKVLEAGDRVVFRLTEGWMGGHALKHVAAAVGLGILFRALGWRKPQPDK